MSMIGVFRGKWARRVALGVGLAFGACVLAADDAQTFFKRAESLYAGGKIKEAVIELKNALQKDPSLAEGRRLLGHIYLVGRDGLSAEKELERARSLGVNDAALRLDLAETYLILGRFRDAVSQVQTDLGGEPKDKVRALALQGGAQMGLKELDAAEQSFTQALELDPKAYSAHMGLVQLDLLRNQPDQARVKVERLLALAPDHTDALIVKAELERKDGRLEPTLELFTKILTQNPQEVRALVGRATSYVALRRFDEASADLDKLEKAVPGLVQGEYLRGLVAFEKKEFDQSRDRLQKVLRVVPDHMPSQLLLGVIGFSRGEFQSADEYLSHVAVAMPNNVQVAKVLGATRIKRKDPRRAIEVLEAAAKTAPKDAQLLALLGSAYLLNGEQAKGAEWLQQAVEFEPNVATLRTQLALGLLAGGATDAAIEQLQGAVDLGQDVIQADVLLVLSHIKQKQFDQAVTASQAMEQRLPNSPIPYNLTGLAFLAKGELDQAGQRFRQALKVDPGFVTAEVNLARLDLANKDLDGAEKRFKGLVQKDPAHVESLLGLAAIAEQRKDMPAMVRWLEQAQDKNPQAPAPGLAFARHYLGAKEPLKALSVATNLNGRVPDNPAVLETLGRAQIAAGETASGVRSLQRLAELVPSPEIHLLLASAQMDSKDWAGGRKSLNKALELKKDFIAARVALGLLELKADYPETALKIAKEVQGLHPQEAVGLELEGRAYLAKKDPTKAAEALDKAYKVKASGSAAGLLAQVYRDLKRPQDGMHVLEDWLRQQPKDGGARMQLAMLYQAGERKADALREYQTLYAEHPENTVLLNNLGWLYFELKDKRALELAKKAYEKTPERAEVVDTYGWVMLHLAADKEKALGLLQQAYTSLPTNQEIGYHVALALHQTGRTEEARRTLQRVLKDGTEFNDAEAAKTLAKQLGL